MSDKTIKVNVLDIAGTPMAMLPGGNARFSGGKLPEKKFKGTRIDNPEEETLNEKWGKWGKNDKFPKQIREQLASVPMAGIALEKLIGFMYGNGIAYYKNSDLMPKEGEEGKKPSVKRAYIKEVEMFLRKNRIQTMWYPGQLADYRVGLNCFSECILSKGGDEIVGIHHKYAEHCRVGIHDPKSKRSEKLYYSPDFSQGIEPEKLRYAEIDLLSTVDYYFDEEYFKKKIKKKFAWHSYFPTPGMLYYATPFWVGLFKKKGWIDVSCKVPEVVNAMMDNQVVLKYQILIPETYFAIRYQEWDTYTDIQREEKINELIDTINDTLQGGDNWFKSITTLFKQDPNTGADLGKVEIIAIDDKVKDDKWVPSSEKSDAQIVQGLGLHPSQVGLSTGGGNMIAGSGSDQREAFNTAIGTNTVHQNIVLEPLNFIAQFNAIKNPNWDITFFIDHTAHTTTNDQESGMKPSETTVEVE